MRNYPTRKTCLRPLLLASVVSMACQSVMAQSISELSATPFANRPLHLDNSFSKTGRLGVKPNVMFFVDDSGSMQALVGGRTERNNPQDIPLRNSDPGAWNSMVNANYANPIPCTFDARNLGTDNNCYHINWPHWGFFRLRQQNNRIRVTIDALNAVVDKFENQWNWNIYTLWGSETRAARNGTTSRNANRYAWWPERHGFMNGEQMKNLVRALSPTGGTPTTSRYVNVARIMKDSIEYRCQKSYVVLVSDGDANQQGIPTLLPWEEDLYGTFSDRTNIERWGPNVWETWTRTHNNVRTQYQPYRAGATNGVSLFSQILANSDLKNDKDRIGRGQIGRDIEGGYWDEYVNPNNPDDPYNNTEDTKQSIQTFVIGFGEGLSRNGENYLRDAATCVEPKDDKCFFKPRTGAELAAAFKVISDSIDAENKPTDVQTFSHSTPAATGSTIADLAAALTLDTGNWSSELKFARFDGKGNLSIVNGKLSMADAGYAGRKVIVNNGNNKYWLDTSSPHADFAIGTVEEFRRAFLPWILRDATLKDADIQAVAESLPSRTVSKYRIRAAAADAPARQMADVIDTPVVALGRVADDNAQQKYVVTAANDGMTYIFQATGVSNQPYGLKLNYLPAGMQRESADNSLTVGKTIRATAEDGYGKSGLNPHVYLNNGGISWVLTPKTGRMNQQYLLLGNMGQGGRGSYALNIGGNKRSDLAGNSPTGLDATESTWLEDVPLWETVKGNTNTMGYTISTSIIGQVATKLDNDRKPKKDEGVHLYAFVPNGHRSNVASIPYDSSPTLYVYDMIGQEFGTSMQKEIANRGKLSNGNLPGKLITKISVNSGVTAGALATPTLVDSNLDGLVDVAYAGDQYGNMYRFDLRGEPSGWKSVMLYEGKKDAAGNALQPITAAPAIYRRNTSDLVVIFGTGSDIYDKDRRDLNQQMVMGIHDDLDIAVPTVIKSADSFILEQTATEIARGGKNLRYLSSNEFVGQPRAWRVILKAGRKINNDDNNMVAAEKVVVQPEVLLGTVFLTTRIYQFEKRENPLPKLPNGKQLTANDRTCFIAKHQSKTAGTSWLMGFDALTGGNPRSDRGAYFDTGSNDPNAPLIAGEDLGSIASAATKINTRKAGGNMLQTNENGELKHYGEITSLDHVSQQLNKPNDCIPARDVIKLLFTTSGGATLRDLKGKICETSLIRTDWREITL